MPRIPKWINYFSFILLLNTVKYFLFYPSLAASNEKQVFFVERSANKIEKKIGV